MRESRGTVQPNERNSSLRSSFSHQAARATVFSSVAFWPPSRAHTGTEKTVESASVNVQENSRHRHEDAKKPLPPSSTYFPSTVPSLPSFTCPHLHHRHQWLFQTLTRSCYQSIATCIKLWSNHWVLHLFIHSLWRPSFCPLLHTDPVVGQSSPTYTTDIAFCYICIGNYKAAQNCPSAPR